MALPTAYSTALSVTTLDDFSSDIWNLIVGRVKILRWFDAQGFVERLQGGANITKRVMYAENDTFGTISAYQQVPLTPQEPFTAAQYAWKIIAGAVSLANLTIFQNSGQKHQISNILTDLIMNAAETGALELSRQIFKDGTTNGGKDFGGLRLLNAANSWGTVGGIDSNLNTWWRNQYAAAVGSFAANGVLQLSTLSVNAARDNTSMNRLYIGDANAVIYYKQTALQMKRIVQEVKAAADMGLPNIEFEGNPFIEDPNQTAGYIDIINPEVIQLVIGTDIGYKKSPMVSPVDQDVKTQLMVLYGNMVCKDRSANALAYGITYP